MPTDSWVRPTRCFRGRNGWRGSRRIAANVAKLSELLRKGLDRLVVGELQTSAIELGQFGLDHASSLGQASSTAAGSLPILYSERGFSRGNDLLKMTVRIEIPPGPPRTVWTTRPLVSHFLRYHDERGSHYMKRTTVLNRREFSRFCLTASACVMTADAAAFGQSSNAAPEGARTVKLRDGRSVPALGQGSARLAHGFGHSQAEEEAALRTGIDLGMTLIDTAEIYGSEELIGRVILIDLLAEEGIVGRSYLEPYLVKSMRYPVPALNRLSAC